MIAQELFKGYDRKSGPKKVVVKVDIQKAYDTLNWQFWKSCRKVDQSRDFQYHFGYKKLKVTNVCFTDDLLMFCHDDKSSVKVLKESIDEFGKVAALIPNYNKSTIIFGSLDDDEKKELLEVMPFKVENLLISREQSFKLEEQMPIISCMRAGLTFGGVSLETIIITDVDIAQNDWHQGRAKLALKECFQVQTKGRPGSAKET
ncbi:hypothetical protein Tco_1285673 [Tanacetum coccineum]